MSTVDMSKFETLNSAELIDIEGGFIKLLLKAGAVAVAGYAIYQGGRAVGEFIANRRYS